MGSTLYSSSSRSLRATDAGYFSKSINDVFEQNKVNLIHESMEPSKALIRESRDSDLHPNSIPIILGLDVTGSMDRIPHFLIKNGLPKIMDGMISKGVLDPQILFLAIGDTRCDNYPLQVGQFESGDLELDTWLTRTYLEGHGGGNGGESYHLAWYFAALHTVSDAWEKRHQKGFIFTIGDDNCHGALPANVIKELTTDQVDNALTNEELLLLAKERYNVYHFNLTEDNRGDRSSLFWKNLLGDNAIDIDDHKNIADEIIKIVTANTNVTVL